MMDRMEIGAGEVVLATVHAGRADLGFCPECYALLPGDGVEALRLARSAHERNTGHSTISVVALTPGQGEGHA